MKSEAATVPDVFTTSNQRVNKWGLNDMFKIVLISLYSRGSTFPQASLDT